MSQHHYGDLSNLNAPYDNMSLQGVGGTLGGPNSLGWSMEEEHNIPWLGEDSHPTVLASQQGINKTLTADGFGPVLEDGRLGPRTCGALHQYGRTGEVWGACDDHSAEFISPKKVGPPPAIARPATDPNAAAPTLARSGGGVPSWVWGLLVGGGAIGVAIYLKKKKGR